MALFRKKDYSVSSGRFAKLAKANPGSKLASRARLQQVFALLAMKQRESARRILKRMLKEEKGKDILADVLFQLGRTYLDSRQPDLAKVFFNRLVDEFGDSENAPEGALPDGGLFLQGERVRGMPGLFQQVVPQVFREQAGRRGALLDRLVPLSGGECPDGDRHFQDICRKVSEK